MSGTKRTEGNDFRKLRNLGMNFSESQDEYSSQPDSCSAIGGIRGVQEYGINSDMDSIGRSSEKRIREVSRLDGVSPLLEENEVKDAEEIMGEAKDTELNNAKLKNLIEERFSTHPQLKKYQLAFEVSGAKVTANGTVKSHALKLCAQELIQACGATEILNKITLTDQ